MRLALAIVLVLVTSVSAAEEIPADLDATRTRLQELLDGNQISAALRYADAAVSAHPGSPDLHYLYGILLMSVVDYPGAVTELEAANALVPDQPLLLEDLANAYLGAGDEVRARALAEKLPESGAAKALLVELAARDRARATPRPEVPPGAPAAVVHEALVAAWEGKPEAFLAAVDVGELAHQVGRDRAAIETAARALLAELRPSVLGWIVDAAATERGEAATVQVRFLVRQTLDRQRLEALARELDQPDDSQGVNPLLAGIRHLDADDRRAMIDRLSRRAEIVGLDARVELGRREGRWWITELVVRDSPATAAVLARLPVAADPPPRPFGPYLVIAAVAVLLVGGFLWWRRR